MVILRSGSVTAVDDSINMAQMTSEQFALFLVEACKQPCIRKMISDIVSPRDQEFADAVPAEVHRQMTPLRKQLDEKNAELQRLKNIIHDQQTMIDDIEQHGRRDSLRFADIPENANHDDTDAAILEICGQMKVEPKVEPKDIAVSHRVDKPRLRTTPRQIIVKFATRNIRERVFKARTELKNVNNAEENKDKPKIYLNEDLTKLRADLAKKARSLKTARKILVTWTMYGKILVKDNFNQVKVITKAEELLNYN